MRTFQIVACAMAFAVPHAAVAQASLPDDHPAGPPGVRLSYQSAFEGYKPYVDIPVVDWRQVNDAVREAAAKGGGHGGHGAADADGARASATGNDAGPRGAAAAEPSMRREAPVGHSSHGSHGGRQ